MSVNPEPGQSLSDFMHSAQGLTHDGVNIDNREALEAWSKIPFKSVEDQTAAIGLKDRHGSKRYDDQLRPEYRNAVVSKIALSNLESVNYQVKPNVGVLRREQCYFE